MKSLFAKRRRLEPIHEFDFAGKTLLCLGDFIRENQYRKSALSVDKATVDAEMEKLEKKVGAYAATSVFVDDSSNLSLESTRNSLKFVCVGIPVHVTWNSDLVTGVRSAR